LILILIRCLELNSSTQVQFKKLYDSAISIYMLKEANVPWKTPKSKSKGKQHEN